MTIRNAPAPISRGEVGVSGRGLHFALPIVNQMRHIELKDGSEVGDLILEETRDPASGLTATIRTVD